jgi:Kef-type K+ transport system membrane component KefB
MKKMKKFTQNYQDAEALDVGFGGTIKRMLMMLFFLFLTTTALFASHFRFGLLTATRLSETSTTVTYRLNSSLGDLDKEPLKQPHHLLSQVVIQGHSHSTTPL